MSNPEKPLEERKLFPLEEGAFLVQIAENGDDVQLIISHLGPSGPAIVIDTSRADREGSQFELTHTEEEVSRLDAPKSIISITTRLQDPIDAILSFLKEKMPDDGEEDPVEVATEVLNSFFSEVAAINGDRYEPISLTEFDQKPELPADDELRGWVYDADGPYL